jgi:hypothetical protein
LIIWGSWKCDSDFDFDIGRTGKIVTRRKEKFVRNEKGGGEICRSDFAVWKEVVNNQKCHAIDSFKKLNTVHVKRWLNATIRNSLFEEADPEGGGPRVCSI